MVTQLCRYLSTACGSLCLPQRFSGVGGSALGHLHATTYQDELSFRYYRYDR